MKYKFLNFDISQFSIILSGFFLFTILAGLFIIFTEPVTVTKENHEIKIPRGATLWQISKILHDNEVIANRRYFVLLAKLKFSQTKLHSGFYDIRNIRTSSQLIDLLKTGQNLSTRVTIPEGSTNADIAALIVAHVNIDSASFVNLTQDSAFIRQLGLNTNSLEGYLFPDTYYFYKNDLEKTIITKMVNTFKMKWQQIAENIPINSDKNLHEILTLASLIEGECILDNERAVVSSLYQNRLKRNMKLEADPTIQYIIPDGPRRILTKDLKIESPYNTYLNAGLPPGPVNNPGIKSIIAAIEPADTDFLYMVAQGDGSHYFTRHYSSFLKAKRKLQKIRQELKEKN